MDTDFTISGEEYFGTLDKNSSLFDKNQHKNKVKELKVLTYISCYCWKIS